jgi:hypothetical protein
MENFYELLEQANLRPVFKFGAITMFAGHEALKELSSKLGVPMEQISPAQIIQESAEKNAESLRFQDYLRANSATPPK